MLIFVAIVLVLALGGGIFALVVSHQMSLIPAMSFEETLAYTTKDNADARVTVGIIQGGQTHYTVYGENAAVLPQVEYEYEIGSVTKTFTTSLLAKAIDEGLVQLGDSIGEYMALPEGYTPTLQRLVTHTSGYKSHYFEWQMASNFFSRRGNDFYGIGDELLDAKVESTVLEDKEYAFVYSNFGISVVGRVLEKIYGQDYTPLMQEFIENELGLANTRISDGTGDLTGYWPWMPGDAYLPAGGILSTVSDMLRYVQIQMNDEPGYLSRGHAPIAQVNATTKQYEQMGIRMDAVGMAWMLDTQSGFVWHNGGTSNFNSYVAFDKDKGVGVVILSNLAPDHGIPATVMGAKLMRTLQAEST